MSVSAEGSRIADRKVSIMGLTHYPQSFSTDPCIENDVQLNGNVVQVCHGSQWGLVCSSLESWHKNAAAVVCQQVGMAYRGQIVRHYGPVPVGGI